MHQYHQSWICDSPYALSLLHANRAGKSCIFWKSCIHEIWGPVHDSPGFLMAHSARLKLTSLTSAHFSCLCSCLWWTGGDAHLQKLQQAKRSVLLLLWPPVSASARTTMPRREATSGLKRCSWKQISSWGRTETAEILRRFPMHGLRVVHVEKRNCRCSSSWMGTALQSHQGEFP